MSLVMVFSVVMAIGIFMVLPLVIAGVFRKVITSETVMAVIEGIIRIAIFITYIKLVSRMEDIRRTFMYHGAEHKCINCIEHGLDLTVENVRKSSRLHKRCGTSFLFFVIIVSVVLFFFVRVDSPLLRLGLRILLIPVIAGISFELIRLAGRREGKAVDLLSKPGMMLQKLTTREPDEDMIEVGIASVEAVFDWKGYVKNLREKTTEQEAGR